MKYIKGTSKNRNGGVVEWWNDGVAEWWSNGIMGNFPTFNYPTFIDRGVIRGFFKMILVFAIIILFGLHAEAKPKIIVAVAANVQYAMNDIKSAFEKSTGIELEIILGSSGQITAQIEQGAPYDVFISADTKYPDYLFDHGFTNGKPKVYAQGSLVLWTMRKDLDLKKGLQEILNANITNIAIANPKTAPYGRAAMQVLQNLGMENKVENKLVYGENISSVNQFIVSKAADIGFSAKSVVLSPAMMHKGKWIDVDSKLYDPIMQSCVMLKEGINTHPNETMAFFRFMFSDQVKDIFKKYGYKIN
ncbi:MAG: molybdate ABC transporter substrate-binding protein [Ignavibacteriaceae bacterium]